MKKIFVIQYQPKKKSEKAEYLETYIQEAKKLGHEVREINLHNIEIEYLSINDLGLPDPVLTSELKEAQDNILWADQIVFAYSVWCLNLPAKFKSFIERIVQKDVLVSYGKMGPEPIIKDKEMVVIQSYSMPYFLMKYVYGDAPFKIMKVVFKNWCGFKIIKRFDFDIIDTVNEKRKQKWLNEIKKFVNKI